MPLIEAEKAYDPLPLGVAVLDSTLRVVAWNSTLSKWSRVERDRAIGKTLSEIFPEFNEEQHRSRFESVFQHGQSLVISAAMHRQFLPLHTSNGWPLLHRTHVSAMDAGSDRALVVLEDVTQSLHQLDTLRSERRRLKASERSLQQQRQELEDKNSAIAEARRRAEIANHAKSAFLANMSHEIRTPLTAINGFAGILQEHAVDDLSRDASERVLRNGEHLLGIINDILDLSKIEAGRLTLKSVACSPVKIAEETIRMLQVRADSKGVSLRLKVEEDLPQEIQADPMRLRQVLLNLVGNAVKFTNEGSVEVSLEVLNSGDGHGEPSSYCFSVKDTGIGILESHLDEIFEPFAQEDESANRRFGGTGLGLAISRQLAHQMGGEVTVSSQHGVGSTFRVVLPLAPTQDEGEAPSTAPSAETVDQGPGPGDGAEAQLTGKRVLVAEDGPDNQQLIRFLLERAGAEVTIVENGQLAVERVEEGHDLIVLDMQMPVMDGYTAAALIRDHGVESPIIALTAHAMDGDRERALASGCDAYATKPINGPKLIRLLARLSSLRDPALC